MCNQQSTTADPRSRRRRQILRAFQETIRALVFVRAEIKAYTITGRVRMQSRDPLVIACASHDAGFKREGEETHEIRRRIHIVRIAVNVEGIVAGG